MRERSEVRVFLIFLNDSWHSGVFLVFSDDSWHSGVHNHGFSFFKSSLRGPLKFCMFLMFTFLNISSELGRWIVVILQGIV